MKSTIAYYLMLLYITVMVHPLLPIVCDAWCHTFYEINHLATVHAKYGTHHLEISVSKSGNDKNDNNVAKTETSTSEHTLPQANINMPAHIIARSFPLLIQSDLFSIFLLNHTPPPKFYC